ncbi:YwdI family protein [Virgibacillus sp. DJP39]|uniref:YwdI family protein n=1 Tax=Virgibacillus sp. DJP39 TaxID=3409790 RepID=UPI003BB715B2
MAISNETILKKMMDELQQAQTKAANHDQMAKHIGNVRLLSDLIMDADHADESVKKTTDLNDFSLDEMEVMLGKANTNKVTDSKHNEDDQDDANGKSIFDF